MAKTISFPFEVVESRIFRRIFRPVALIYFYSRSTKVWVPVWGIVDSGADYTLLPRGYAQKLGIDLKRDCTQHPTLGIGGEEKSYIYHKGRIKVGDWERAAPIGFLDRVNVPPLIGRQGFLETFEVIFRNHETILKDLKAKDRS